jgi:hypothetical protein
MHSLMHAEDGSQHLLHWAGAAAGGSTQPGLEQQQRVHGQVCVCACNTTGSSCTSSSMRASTVSCWYVQRPRNCSRFGASRKDGCGTLGRDSQACLTRPLPHPAVWGTPPCTSVACSGAGCPTGSRRRTAAMRYGSSTRWWCAAAWCPLQVCCAKQCVCVTR